MGKVAVSREGPSVFFAWKLFKRIGSPPWTRFERSCHKLYPARTDESPFALSRLPNGRGRSSWFGPQVGLGSEHGIDSIGSYWFCCNVSTMFVQKCPSRPADSSHVTVFKKSFVAADRGGFHRACPSGRQPSRWPCASGLPPSSGCPPCRRSSRAFALADNRRLRGCYRPSASRPAARRSGIGGRLITGDRLISSWSPAAPRRSRMESFGEDLDALGPRPLPSGLIIEFQRELQSAVGARCAGDLSEAVVPEIRVGEIPLRRVRDAVSLHP
jgi:hypothetical protein